MIPLGVLASARVEAAAGDHILFDDFSRTNPTSLGTAPTGQTWTYPLGSWAIDSGMAASTHSSGFSYAIADVGVSDFVYSARIPVMVPIAPSANRLVFRYVDTANHLSLTATYHDVDRYKLELARRVSTTYTAIQVINNLVSQGDLLTVSAVGSIIKIFVNETQVYQNAISYFLNATKIGLVTYNSTDPRFDDVTVDAP